MPPPPPESLSIPSAAPDHWWSRKPKEERRPLGSRLLKNFWEFRHPGKVLAAAFLAVVLVGSVMALVISVGGDGADEATTAPTVFGDVTPEDEGAVPDELPFAAGIPAGATFSGPLEGDATVRGDVSFEISSTGDEVESFEANFDFNDYQCSDSATVLSAEVTITHMTAAPIVAGGFEIEGSFVVDGNFDSTTSASGTMSADLELLPGGCGIGPFDWTATAR